MAHEQDGNIVHNNPFQNKTELIAPIAEGHKDKHMVFMTMIGATDETMDGFIKMLSDIDELRNNYEIVLTSLPTQYMNPLELIDSLKLIHNVSEDADPNNVGITRTDRFRQDLRYTHEYMVRSMSVLRAMEQNIIELVSAVNNLSAQSSPGIPSVHHLQSNYDMESLQITIDKMKKIVPNEAEHM